ncbi:MAG: toast rack family protein [Anaerolineales bacterium]
MKRIIPLFLMILFSATVSACGVGIDLPFKTEMKTGPTQTESIQIPIPAGDAPVDVTLSFGAGKLTLLPNPGDDFISGTASYNVEDFKPIITSESDKIFIKQGNLKLNAVPKINQKIKNEWSLAFSSYPMDLTIKSGAYTGEYEFGGLAITDLHIADGASNVTLTFSTPNPTNMQAFRYETGASNISMEKLGNANFEIMLFESGAGNYNLDFSGNIRQDAAIFIETGLSRLVITVPHDTPATAQFEGSLSKVTAKGNWEQNGEEYTQDGEGPRLTFTIETNAGTVTLQNP